VDNKLSIGLYSVPEASRLVNVPARSIRRWLFGYLHSHTNKSGKQSSLSPPLWEPQYKADDFSEKVIGFRDLMEIRFVSAFVGAGLPLAVVRQCLETARNNYGEYPLSTRRFGTDGKTIFHDAVGAHAELFDLRKRQYAFGQVIRPSLYAGIEYQGSVALRWFPETRSQKNIVIDPELGFGKPALIESGVPTSTLYASFLIEDKSTARVARIFELPKAQVEAAIKFEEKLAA
jgi:uncharacterized protein (DUF433 family)